MSVTDLDATMLEELALLDPQEGIGLARELVGIFFSEAPNRLSRMRSGISEADGRKLSQAAHAMRGGAGGLGAVGLASACARIERQARTGDLAGLDAEIATIAANLPALEVSIASLIQRLESSRARA